MIAGVLSCGITHTVICPLDVVKCNMQTNPTKYKGLVSGMKMLIREEGSAAVWKGALPTAIGYSMQGFCKFGFYEIFKDFYSNLAGEENAYVIAHATRPLPVCLAAAPCWTLGCGSCVGVTPLTPASAPALIVLCAQLQVPRLHLPGRLCLG